MDNDRLRLVARGAISDLAEEELPLFDLQWAEVLENPALLDRSADKSDQHLGAGAAAEVSLMSLIVIPLVIAIGKDLTSAASKGLLALAKKWLLKKKEELPAGQHLSEEEIDRIARAVAERFERTR